MRHLPLSELSRAVEAAAGAAVYPILLILGLAILAIAVDAGRSSMRDRRAGESSSRTQAASPPREREGIAV